jgi:phosphatidylglycerol---prolipoprotein diacylglyceryl transferase
MACFAAIQFPGLNPIAFHLGPVGVRWYGLAYLAGFAVAYAWLLRMSRRGSLHLSAEDLSNLIPWLIFGVLFGGRLGWWLFYHHNINEREPSYEPVAIWHGGMSFHGGLLGVAFVLVVWSRLYRLELWNLADCAALVTPVGLFFGRIANFVNAELVGRITDLPWGVIFPGESVPRHPSQLYEALLEGPVLLASLWVSRRLRSHHPGQLGSLFVIYYGLIRFVVEFTRQPDAQLGFIAFGWLTMGQILSTALVFLGVLLFVRRSHAVAVPANAALGPLPARHREPLR